MYPYMFIIHIMVHTYKIIKQNPYKFIQKLQAVIYLVHEIYYEQVFLLCDFDSC